MSFLPFVFSGLLVVVICQQNQTCDDGWVYNSGSCYRFVQDHPGDLAGAMESCAFMDSRLVFAEDNNEVSFLSEYAKGQNVSGWYTGYQTSFYESSGEETFVPDWSGEWVLAENDMAIKFPEKGTDVEETSKCVAFTPLKRSLSREPCRVRLAYICTGTKAEAVNPDLDSVHWIQKGNVIMYVSKTSDQVSYSEGEKVCQDKGLSLMIAKDKKTFQPFEWDLTDIWDEWANGMWWIGLQVTDNGYQWSDGSEFNGDVATFKQPHPFGTFNWMLMADGKIRPAIDTDYKFSYICKKNSSPVDHYGCPPAWYRAGTSCYHKTISTKLDASNAAIRCSTKGAHLLTVESHDEKLWLERSTFLQHGHPGFWTSLNDKAKEGEYVWENGTTADPDILKWVQPLSPFTYYGYKQYSARLRAEGRACVAFLEGGSLGIYDCGETVPFACQYTLSTGMATSCLDGWLQYKGVCYYLPPDRNTAKYMHLTWHSNLVACVSIVEKSDPTIRPDYIKIDSFDLVPFLSNNTSAYFWTGLSSVDSPPMLLWNDGSKPNLSFFKVNVEPDNGNGEGEQDCASIQLGAVFEDNSCDEKLLFICEKELG